MSLNTLESALSFLKTNSYGVIFLIMIIEGPMITVAAAFAASMGLLNIWLVFALSLLGDNVSDMLHYAFGRYVKRSTVHRFSKFLGMEHLPKHLATQFKKKTARTLLVLKLTPPLAQAGMILAGTFRVKFKTFWWYTFIGAFIRTTILVIIGYFFGVIAAKALEYFNLASFWLVIFFVGLIVVLIIIKIIMDRLPEKYLPLKK